MAGPGLRQGCVPALDPAALEQAIYKALAASDSHAQCGQICEDWLGLARQRGMPVDEHGDLLPGVLEVISRTVWAVWFGLTAGYLIAATRTGADFHATRPSPG
jgi:hypothetical protein